MSDDDGREETLLRGLLQHGESIRPSVDVLRSLASLDQDGSCPLALQNATQSYDLLAQQGDGVGEPGSVR